VDQECLLIYIYIYIYEVWKTLLRRPLAKIQLPGSLPGNPLFPSGNLPGLGVFLTLRFCFLKKCFQEACREPSGTLPGHSIFALLVFVLLRKHKQTYDKLQKLMWFVYLLYSFVWKIKKPSGIASGNPRKTFQEPSGTQGFSQVKNWNLLQQKQHPHNYSKNTQI